jgi:CRP-like cAMP-binding protein
MPTPSQPFPNQLLAALPPAERARLEGSLEPVPMRLGEMLYEPGMKPRHAYFPTTAVVSLHTVMASGASAEFSGVGNEGVVGISLFMGGDTMPSAAVVQTAGEAMRLEGRLLARAFDDGGALRVLLLRYVQALVTQTAQTAACYRHHTVEQQLARWLLQTVERVPAGDVVMTQELVGIILGVRRESITQAAGRLQDAGYVRYRRGHLSIVDPAGLRRSACECFGVVQRELRRLAPGALPASHELRR